MFIRVMVGAKGSSIRMIRGEDQRAGDRHAAACPRVRAILVLVLVDRKAHCSTSAAPAVALFTPGIRGRTPLSSTVRGSKLVTPGDHATVRTTPRSSEHYTPVVADARFEAGDQSVDCALPHPLGPAQDEFPRIATKHGRTARSGIVGSDFSELDEQGRASSAGVRMAQNPSPCYRPG